MGVPRVALVLLASLVPACLAGCSTSSTSQPKLLVITPNPSVTAPPLPAFHAPCHALPEAGKTVSHAVFSGPCRLTETAAVKCIHQLDDFYAFIHRPLQHGWVFDVSINVEHYSHPGTYTRTVQIYVQLSKGQSIDAWGNNFTTGTITANERSLILPPTTAPGYAGTVKVQPEVISGSLVCR